MQPKWNDRFRTMTHSPLFKHIALFLCGVLLFGNCWATERQALVIGNGNYQGKASLANAINDARAVADQLSKLGFEVSAHYDLKLGEMRKAIENFSRQLNPGSIVAFFYAGHGIQYHGANYLIPVDANISHSYEIDYHTFNLSMALSALTEAEPILVVALLDACRNNPYEQAIKERSRAMAFKGSGLAAIEDIQGTIISYATEPGKVATDGTDSHSPYTQALLKHLDTPNLSVQDMLNRVGLEVMSRTHGGQKPWFSSSPVPQFCFAGCSVQMATSIGAPLAEPAATRGLPNIFSIEGSQIERVRLALVSHDLDSLKKLADLDQEQEVFLRQLFDTYPKLAVELEKPVSQQAAANSLLSFRITEAINRAGNRVIPSPSWNHVSLQLANPGAQRSPATQ